MSSHRYRDSGSNLALCKECVRLDTKGHKDARKPKYCANHQCVTADSSGILCTKRKKTAELRCTRHASCTLSNCNKIRIFGQDGIVSDYCVDHTCVVENCISGKLHDPRRGSHNDLCADHLALICALQDCLHWSVENSRYCTMHKCHLCKEKVVNEERPFCVEHNQCTVDDCTKARCQSGDQFENECTEHYRRPCRLLECDNKSSRSSRFCELHCCQHRKCNSGANPSAGRPFCSEHRCTDEGCEFLRTFSSANDKLKINQFCPNHECGSDACLRHVQDGKPYCTSHCCMKRGCTTKRHHDLSLGNQCLEHYNESIVERTREEIAAQQEQEQILADELLAANLSATEESRGNTRRYRSPESRPSDRYQPDDDYRYYTTSGRRHDVPESGRRGQSDYHERTPGSEYPRAGQQPRTRTWDEFRDGARHADETERRPRSSRRYYGGIATPEPEERLGTEERRRNPY